MGAIERQESHREALVNELLPSHVDPTRCFEPRTRNIHAWDYWPRTRIRTFSKSVKNTRNHPMNRATTTDV
jgi:hypothetical protein